MRPDARGGGPPDPTTPSARRKISVSSDKRVTDIRVEIARPAASRVPRRASATSCFAFIGHFHHSEPSFILTSETFGEFLPRQLEI
jgi:hypothetical protein